MPWLFFPHWWWGRWPLQQRIKERMIMKYVCKELWTYLFHQPASRLQADKRGGSLDCLRLLTLDWWVLLSAVRFGDPDNANQNILVSIAACGLVNMMEHVQICSTCRGSLRFGKLGMLRLHHYRSILSLAGGLCGQQFRGLRDTGWFGKIWVSDLSVGWSQSPMMTL